MSASKLIAALSSTLAAAIVVWATALPMLVYIRASMLANGKPVCIFVTGDRLSYRPAKNWLDLTGFAMRVPFESGGGSMDAQWTFHAIIFVEGSLHNWSHLQMNFVPIQRPGMLGLDSERFRCEGRQ